MAQLRVEAEGVALAAPEDVWELVANADSYSEWGPWSASGYENLGTRAPDGAGVVRWMRYGRTTTVEKVLESERARRLVYTVVKSGNFTGSICSVSTTYASSTVPCTTPMR